ncbi:MAG: menaquinone biosynthesis decarboxylase [Bacteroidales bacterium]
MAYNGLRQFVRALEQQDELMVTDEFVDPVLQVAELADRFVKNGERALLLNNTGTGFPVLINMFASDKRMSMALGRSDLDEAGKDIEDVFSRMSSPANGLLEKIKMLPGLAKLASYMPKKVRGKGVCQQNIIEDPDLGILPALKCWPHDGGRFITLPVVHTRHPVSGEVNAGMYRMQLMDGKTTGMHWHRHKTGANHYEAWKEKGEKMPVSVVLGGDPVYTYAATAPLPQGVDEYILAGFLRKKRVKMVKCISNDLWVPEDADIVIEGYIDTDEDLIWEGPFGDHTGFYSLADWYPAFHVSRITHRKDAIYPATVVGVPPMEDAWIGKATEKLFLSPIKLTLQPEIIDLHMPPQGVAHNLVLVKIEKSYPGQGMKVINSLFGAGQMMFSKFIIVVSDDTDLRDYRAVAAQVFLNTDFEFDIMTVRGPLDVLDHASDTFSFGGKLGIDASVKLPGESNRQEHTMFKPGEPLSVFKNMSHKLKFSMPLPDQPLVIVGLSKESARFSDIMKLKFSARGLVAIIVDSTLDLKDNQLLAWQVLANTDPQRDLRIVEGNIFIDSTSKSHFSDNFKRDWPNVVISDDTIIAEVDDIVRRISPGKSYESPSLKLKGLDMGGGASVSAAGN